NRGPCIQPFSLPFDQHQRGLLRQQIVEKRFQQRVLTKDFGTDAALDRGFDLGLAGDIVFESN
ncbi:hypothetical protein BC936DRAFT_147742, partial [Jimgerdemannia flammicorona]